MMPNRLKFRLLADLPKNIMIGFERTKSLPFWIEMVVFTIWSTLLNRFKSRLIYDNFFASSYDNPLISMRRLELRSIFVRLGNLTLRSDFKFVILFCQSKSSYNDSAFRVYSWWREHILFPPRLSFFKEPKLT